MIGIPYLLDFTMAGGLVSFQPGRGFAGWTVWHAPNEEAARDILRALPRMSWMAGTRRLAAKLGVKE